MRNGFMFKNRHSSELGVTVRTKSRPVLPSVKESITDLPCRDGGYDFSRANPFGREFYNDRIITVSLVLLDGDIYQMQKKLTELSMWLSGEGELIFDDMPFVAWYGKVSDEIIYMPEHSGRKAAMEVSFRVRPFGACVFDTDGPTIGLPLELNSNIPIDISAGYKTTIKGVGTVNVYNFGDRPIRPVITLGKNAREAVLSLGDKSLSFVTIGETEIDFEKQSVKNADGYVPMTGDFFEFASGDNLLKITNSLTKAMTVEISFKPCFMYGEHFDDLEWGDGDA